MNAATQMRAIGFADAKATPVGPDSGIDVKASGAIAQVKWRGGQVPRADIQRLFGARGHNTHQKLLFFAASGYTKSATECADELQVMLFTYDPSGELTSVNRVAANYMEDRRRRKQAEERRVREEAAARRRADEAARQDAAERERRLREEAAQAAARQTAADEQAEARRKEREKAAAARDTEAAREKQLRNDRGYQAWQTMQAANARWARTQGVHEKNEPPSQGFQSASQARPEPDRTDSKSQPGTTYPSWHPHSTIAPASPPAAPRIKARGRGVIVTGLVVVVLVGLATMFVGGGIAIVSLPGYLGGGIFEIIIGLILIYCAFRAFGPFRRAVNARK